MKKILLVMAILATLCMAGCNQNVTNEISDNADNSQSVEQKVETQEINVVQDTNAEGETNTTKEETLNIDLRDKYGIGELDYASNEHFISNAMLEKVGESYKINLEISSSKIYDKSTVMDALNHAKEEGNFKLDNCIVYADINKLIEENDFQDRYTIDANENRNIVLGVYAPYNILAEFIPTPKDTEKYILVTIPEAGGANGFVETDIEKNITVDVDKNMRMVFMGNGEYDNVLEDTTIGEYYSRMGTCNLGTSEGFYGGRLNNAINFIDNTIAVRVKTGGV